MKGRLAWGALAGGLLAVVEVGWLAVAAPEVLAHGGGALLVLGDPWESLTSRATPAVSSPDRRRFTSATQAPSLTE
jgi:hypothetical protein